jgi:hypothetical protein
MATAASHQKNDSLCTPLMRGALRSCITGETPAASQKNNFISEVLAFLIFSCIPMHSCAKGTRQIIFMAALAAPPIT